MKIYALAAWAQRSELRRDHVSILPFCVIATDEAAARAFVIKKYQEDLPIADGWYNHAAECMDISEAARLFVKDHG